MLMLRLILTGLCVVSLQADPLTRFPGYYHFFGNHVGPFMIRTSTYNIPTYNRYCQFLPKNEMMKQIQFNAALMVAQETLLKKSVRDWNWEDIWKIHAIMYGGFKRRVHASLIGGMPVKQNETQETTRVNYRSKFTCLLKPGVDPNDVLTTDDYQVFHDYFTRCPFPEYIERELVEFIEVLHTAPFENCWQCAAFVHCTVTCVRPFPNGNGVIARLLANIVLMQSAINPFIVEDNIDYFHAIRACDLQLSTQPLSDFFRKAVEDTITFVRQDLAGTDINGVPTTADLPDNKKLQTLFNSFNVHEENAIGHAQELLYYGIKKLDLPTPKSCHQCLTKKEVKEGTYMCKKCERAYYCSHQCQQQAWSVHKKICTPSEEQK